MFPMGGAVNIENASRRIFATYVVATVLLSVLFPVVLGYYPRVPFGTQSDWFAYSPTGYDLSATYQAAANVRQGLNPYHHIPEVGAEYLRPGSGADGFNRYSYPPLQAFFLLPLAYFSFEHAYYLWTVVTVLLVVASIYIASRMFVCSKMVFVSGLMVYAQSSFLFFQLERGQTDALVLLFVCLAVFFVIVSRWSCVSGICCAVAAMLKVTPAIFIVMYIVRGDARAVVSFVVSCVVVVWLTGVDLWIYWFTVVMPYYSKYRVGLAVDHSFSYLATIIADDAVSQGIGRLSALCLFVVFYYFVFRNPRRDDSFLVEISVLSLIMNVVTPWSANYKLLVLLFVFLVPYALVGYEFVRRNMVLVLWPFSIAMILVVPAAAIYLLRFCLCVVPLFYTSPDVPRAVVLDMMLMGSESCGHLVSGLIDRKVALGLLALCVWMVCLYVVEIGLFKKINQAVARHVGLVWSMLSRIFAGAFVLFVSFFVCVVMTKGVRSDRVASFERPADVVEGILPYVSSVAGLGPHELEFGVRYRWGFGPKTVYAFVTEPGRQLCVDVEIDTPIENLGVDVFINGRFSGEISSVPYSSTGDIASMHHCFESADGLNSISMSYSLWNGFGYVVSERDDRPLAARIRSFSVYRRNH